MNMFVDKSESYYGPGFCMSPESIRVLKNTKRLLHINDIILVNATLV